MYVEVTSGKERVIVKSTKMGTTQPQKVSVSTSDFKYHICLVTFDIVIRLSTEVLVRDRW